jgi:hypothetical protein
MVMPYVQLEQGLRSRRKCHIVKLEMVMPYVQLEQGLVDPR